MAGVRDLAERMWQGDLDTVHEHHPVHSRLDGVEEIDDGLLYFKGIAAVSTIDTGDGLVMLDTGATNETRVIHESIRAWRPDAPLRAAVFSHHHVDHVFGVGPFEQDAEARGWAKPVVHAHELVPAHFDRYRKTLGWNTAINKRQFAIHVDRFRWPEQYRYPDVTYRQPYTFRSGSLTFELHPACGETEDATWTWVLERRILAPGDLFIWAVPNAGNPQKVQRYAGDWAVALREMAALGAETMIPGHGLPMFGADRIRTALEDTAALLEHIEAQTLNLMNQGVTLDRVLHEVEIPADALEKPYLRPVYDHPQFLIRNIWRLYGGWWNGEPDELLPAPRAQQAQEWVNLAGGVRAVLDRAQALADAGDLRMACHLVEMAVLAAPTDGDVHALRTAIYRRRSQEQVSSMARNILNHAALASEQGKRDLAGS